jgi:hypothetical protein
MKREGKGQRVKTFKAWIPQQDLTKIETQVGVYFKPDSGRFYIYDGAHMFAAAAERAKKSYEGRDVHIRDTMITDNTLDGLLNGFKAICFAYEEEMKNAAKKKVIRFTFKANTEWDGSRQPKSDISFCGAPAIHLMYEVLYQVGDQVYFQDAEDGRLQYRGKADEARHSHSDAVTIDWTPEREAFFENMRQSLVTLINRVDDFQKNLLVNVDNAIAATTQLLLENRSKDE